MFDETLAKGNSIVHRLDPRFKIAVALGFSIAAAVGKSWPAAALALAAGATLVMLARLPARQFAGRLLTVNGFVLALGVVLALTYPGAVLYRLGPVEVSRDGTALAGLILVKSNAVVLVCLALLSTSTSVAMAHALWHLRMPNKIVQVLFFTIRYFSVIHSQYHRLRCAMRSRAFRPRMNMHTYRSCGNLVGMLLVGGHDRAEQIHKAMLCRGFKGRLYVLGHFAASRRDWMFAALAAPVAVLIGLMQWTNIIL
ncbi:MAG: cobalt ECF transporter T component CbiQ [Phycisphaerae bacterium]|nr:cobalt ECF transporter T component CbiQ [Phycisphaerae bacterium]